MTPSLRNTHLCFLPPPCPASPPPASPAHPSYSACPPILFRAAAKPPAAAAAPPQPPRRAAAAAAASGAPHAGTSPTAAPQTDARPRQLPSASPTLSRPSATRRLPLLCPALPPGRAKRPLVAQAPRPRAPRSPSQSLFAGRARRARTDRAFRCLLSELSVKRQARARASRARPSGRGRSLGGREEVARSRPGGGVGEERGVAARCVCLWLRVRTGGS